MTRRARRPRAIEWLLSVAAAACSYDPTLADCTITCSAASGCPSGFACGAEGYCRVAGVTASCAAVLDGGSGGGIDASTAACPCDPIAQDGCAGDVCILWTIPTAYQLVCQGGGQGGGTQGAPCAGYGNCAPGYACSETCLDDVCYCGQVCAAGTACPAGTTCDLGPSMCATEYGYCAGSTIDCTNPCHPITLSGCEYCRVQPIGIGNQLGPKCDTGNPAGTQGIQCMADHDCAAGHICVAGVGCARVCTMSSTCPGGTTCGAHGYPWIWGECGYLWCA